MITAPVVNEPLHQPLQIDLFASIDGWRKRFEDFHLTNPQIYLLFERFAKELIAKGHKKLGARMIIERIRWECATNSQKDDAGFKINNMFIAHYARLFIQKNPQYKDYFEFREIKRL